MYKIDIDWPCFSWHLVGTQTFRPTRPANASLKVVRLHEKENLTNYAENVEQLKETTGPNCWLEKPWLAFSHGNPMVSTWENQNMQNINGAFLHGKTASCLEALEKTLLITIHGLGTRNVDQHQIWIFCAQTRLIQIQTRFYIVKLLRIVNTRLELDFPVEIRLGTRTTWEICCSLEINQRPVTLYVTR